MEGTRKKPGDTWENHVEKQIREAIERGDFDDLKGKGKPQEFKNYPGDPSMEMADKIVKDAGFSPAWAEVEREIEQEQKEAEDSLLRSWRWREVLRGDAIEDPRWVEAEWCKARALFEQRLNSINGKILNFNLQLPPPLLHKQRPRLRLEVEFEKLGVSES